MADVQRFGSQRIIKRGSLGASLSWLETTSTANRDLYVNVANTVSTVPAVVALTPLTATRASVGAANSLILDANALRKGLVLTNANLTSIAGIPVYLGVASAAVLGSGIVLTPGGVWEMDPFTFSTACITAIASAGGIASLAIQEFTA